MPDVVSLFGRLIAGLLPRRPRFDPGTVHEICSGQSGTRTGTSPIITAFPCQYHSTNAPYSTSPLSEGQAVEVWERSHIAILTSEITEHSRNNIRTCTFLFGLAMVNFQTELRVVCITQCGFQGTVRNTSRVRAGRGNRRHHCSYWFNELSQLAKLAPLWHGEHETMPDYFDARHNSVTFKIN
jgi:hypothetical protein